MTRPHCCTCSCADDERPSQPATSTDAHRRAVIRGALAVLETKRRARTTVRPTEETPDE